MTFTDASDGPSPASSGLFGIGFVEIAVGLLALSGLGLLTALLLARRRHRERPRRDLQGPRHVRPVGPYPGGGPVYRGQVHPAGPGPGHPNPGYPNPARPNPGGPKQYPGDRRPW